MFHLPPHTTARACDGPVTAFTASIIMAFVRYPLVFLPTELAGHPARVAKAERAPRASMAGGYRRYAPRARGAIRQAAPWFIRPVAGRGSPCGGLGVRISTVPIKKNRHSSSGSSAHPPARRCGQPPVASRVSVGRLPIAPARQARSDNGLIGRRPPDPLAPAGKIDTHSRRPVAGCPSPPLAKLARTRAIGTRPPDPACDRN